ncbi:peptidylprolyl isomerase [Kitasatospora sp. HPMI-4]|uniref:peptidylprolyl isomerase n=1 Tax=Kitasatospora sp. HPMI-4 TaxID=3448443 RepID=UPI003F1DB98D
MSDSDRQGKPRTTTTGTRRAVRAAATALAVTTAGAALTWTAVLLTGESADAGPLAPPPPACSYLPTGSGGSARLPSFDAAAAARPYTATLVTNRGTVTFEALTGRAPCATNSFAFLAGKKYFDGSRCHRLTTKGIFVLDCGDPTGQGAADPGYFFRDENLADAAYPAGTVAMSKVVPGQNGSQFFISYADPELRMPSEWTPFGKVTSGLDVLKEIAGNGTADGSTDGRPKDPVVIESVTVRQHAADSPARSTG